jgi:hypothetical protein
MIAVKRAKLTKSNIGWLNGCGVKWRAGGIFSDFNRGNIVIFRNEGFTYAYYPSELFHLNNLKIANSGDEFCNAIAYELKIKRPYEDKNDRIRTT